VNNSEISKKELNIQKTLVRDDVNIGRPGTRSLFIVLLYSSGSGTDKIFPVSSFIFLQKQRKTRLVEKKIAIKHKIKPSVLHLEKNKFRKTKTPFFII
jgi:hypothetical protein